MTEAPLAARVRASTSFSAVSVRRACSPPVMIGDPDPYTAIMNALQYFRVDDIVISTFAETKSGWLRADLIERVRRATGKPVEHIVQQESETAAA